MKITPLLKAARAVCGLTRRKEDLWQEIAKLYRTYEYILQENSFDRLQMELNVIEAHSGKDRKTEAVRTYISRLKTAQS